MSPAERIVLIDDDRVVGEIVSALANSMGLHCAVTRTADEFFQHIGPDTGIIILDLVMPGMDGIEILRLLGERNCKARIILMSGINIRVIETAKKLAQSHGLTVIGHLQKPFPIPQLQQLLSPHLKLKSKSRSPTRICTAPSIATKSCSTTSRRSISPPVS
jgi:DNA-binding NtrC family response regulator